MRRLPLLAVLLLMGASAPAPASAGPGASGCTQAVKLAAPFAVGGECPGVRPGSAILVDLGEGGTHGCTMNFLFEDRKGRRYAGTAGHCSFPDDDPFIDDGLEQMWAAGTGPPVLDALTLDRIGEIGYAIETSSKDFAVVRLDPGVESDPEMCSFGGPTGLYTGHSSRPVVLHHYGNGLGVGSTAFVAAAFGIPLPAFGVVPARTGIATDTRDKNFVWEIGAAINGDSGSGVIDDRGTAVGVLVWLDPLLGFDGSLGEIVITRLDAQLPRAEQQLGVNLSLLTAPLA